MRVLFFVSGPQYASTRYRILQFLPVLDASGIKYTISPFMSPQLYAIKNEKSLSAVAQKIVLLSSMLLSRLVNILRLSSRYDVIFLQREAFPFFTPFFENLVRRLNENIILDFDDAVFSRPTHEANWRDILRNPERFGDVVKLSKLVVVGNDYLYNYARKFNENTIVIPTVLDMNRYHLKAFRATSPVTIGWIGSWSTLGSLKLLESVFSTLTKKYDIRVKVVGAKNIYSFRPANVSIEHKLWNEEDEIADLLSFDIGVMPLPDNEWEKGKCGFKLLQYMAVGIPAVASPVGVNTQIAEDGKNGFLASTEEEWVYKLGRLIEDFELRCNLGLEGRMTVEANYTLQAIGPRFLGAIRHFELM